MKKKWSNPEIFSLRIGKTYSEEGGWTLPIEITTPPAINVDLGGQGSSDGIHSEFPPMSGVEYSVPNS